VSDAWLPPDSRLPDAVPAVQLTGAVETSGSPDADELVRSPVPIRPMTVADVLDGGITIIKAAPRTIFAIAAVFVVPYELVSAWLRRDALTEGGFSGVLSALDDSGSNSAITGETVVTFIVTGLILSFIAGAIGHLVSSWYAERTPTTGDALRATFERAPALVAAWFVVHVAEGGAALALFVPAIFLMPLFLVTAPVIVVERLGPWRGVRRSWQLTRARYGAVLGAALLIALVDLILSVALGAIGLVFAELPYGWVGDVTCQAAASLVTIPFVAAATVLVYLDLRIRTEGLDLELEIAEHFRRGD
jgi:hypothetical protein